MSKGVLAALAVGGVTVIAASGVGMALSDSTSQPQAELEDPSPQYAPDSNFPAPVIRTLAEPLDTAGLPLKLEPPAPESKPAVDGASAVEIAEREFGPSAQPNSVIAELAVETTTEALVWAVAFRGVCVPIYGAARGTDVANACAGEEMIAWSMGSRGRPWASSVTDSAFVAVVIRPCSVRLQDVGPILASPDIYNWN